MYSFRNFFTIQNSRPLPSVVAVLFWLFDRFPRTRKNNPFYDVSRVLDFNGFSIESAGP